MLVLSRKLYDNVLIRVNGEVIVVQVTQIEPGRVRLGFTANQDVAVYREEAAPADLIADAHRMAAARNPR
jgi:carbon storage regulator CsrA